MAALMTMQSRVTSFSSLYTKVFDGTNIDNAAFQFHYKVTCPLLIVFGLFVSGFHYVHGPIQCTGASGAVPDKVLEEYCWVHSTYSISESGKHKVYQDYYQWIRLFLLAQSVFFCIPRVLWKLIENGKVRRIVSVLDTDTNGNSYNVVDKTAYLARVLCDTFERGHSLYGISFFLCEILNFANVFFQFYFTNWFLDGRFFEMDNETKHRNATQNGLTFPMGHFPTMTKCDIYNSFGFDNQIEVQTGFCVLPLNAVNPILFSFLWYWFLSLVICSGLVVVHRTFWIVFPTLRWKEWTNGKIFQRSRASRTSLIALDIGNVLLLHFVCRNVPWVSFRTLIRDIESIRSDREKDKDNKGIDLYLDTF